MPAELKAKWLEALRSGKYQQCQGTLYNGEGYCCLGVLQMVADGKVEYYVERGDIASVKPSPTANWYRAHNMHSFNSMSDIPGYRSAAADGHLTQRNDGYTHLVGDEVYAVAPISFLEIADFIEQNVAGV